jgi:predicted DNA-binding ribbon-helix-helix protein
MMRTQIQLSEEQHGRLKDIAHKRGLSLAAVIRRWVDEKLEETGDEGTREDHVRAALSACGRYEDPEGTGDVASDHDRHLADAFAR